MKTCRFCGQQWGDDKLKCWDGVNGCGALFESPIDLESIEKAIALPQYFPLAPNFFPKYATVLTMFRERCEYIRADDRILQLVARDIDNRTEKYLRGSGVEEPLGILRSSAVICVHREKSNTIYPSDVYNILENFCISDFGLWIMHPMAYLELYLRKDPSGNGLFSGDTLYRFPIVVTNSCPHLGQFGDILLADLRYYLIGKYVTPDGDEWVDGMPIFDEPLEEYDRFVSPFVVLSGDMV